MTARFIDIVETVAPKACVELFATNGVRLVRPGRRRNQSAPPPLNRATVAGVVGFAGAEIRGTVVIVSTFSLLAAARPKALGGMLSESSSSDWILVRDWAGELANQLLGRITNRLAHFGIALRASTPVALSGHALAYARPASKDTRPFVFTWENQQIWFWFDAVYDKSLKLEPVASETIPNEGDVVFFDE
jgi:CheY-specific phosphatase CheX